MMLLIVLMAVSCNNQESLQEFYVEKQEAENYNALDLSTNLLLNDNVELEPQQEKTLKTIKKINILAYPVDETNKVAYQNEQKELAEVLKNGAYETLFKFNTEGINIEFFYSGNEESIDELIAVAKDDEKGFAVARVLGDDMKPGDMLKLLKSLEKEEINSGGLEQISQIFKN